MYSERPMIQLQLKPIDKWLEALSLLGLIALWVITIASSTNLPATIPTHFNLSGAIDGYGSIATFILLPLIITVIFVVLTVINKYPHIFNYPVAITEANAPKQYLLATRLIRLVKLIVVIVFIIIQWSIISAANHKSYSSHLFYLLPCLGILLFAPIILFYKASKNNV